MEIKIQLKNRVLAIIFGWKTDWFDSIYFLFIAEEFYENRQVVHANMLYGFGVKPKFKCACGKYNYNLQDWLYHWKHGVAYESKLQQRLHAIKLFLLTRVEFK